MTQQKPVDPKKAAEVTLEDLAQQIEALKHELADLSRSASAFARQRGEHAVDEARGRARDALHRGEEQVDAVQRALTELPDDAMSAVRRQPAAALAIAAGLGFLFGIATGRK